MSLKEKVKNALKWKKNSEYCAERIGITEEEFETGVNDLAILQLEEKKTTRAHLIDLLTKTSRDKSKFSFLFDPLI